MRTQRAVRLFSAAAFVIAAGAAADVTPVPVGEAKRADPIRIAGARMLPGGGYARTTPWMQYAGAGTDSEDVQAFASLETDGWDACGPDAGPYLLKDGNGEVVHSPDALTNMKVPDEHRGAQANGAEFYYWWTDNGDGNYWYIAIFTWEEVSTDCALPAMGQGYDGVVLTFNPLSTGFWYTPALGLDAYGLFFQMPMDGVGGFSIFIAEDFGDTCDFPPCPYGPAQVALWGTSNNGGSPGRPGESTDPTWSDRDGNGKYDPATECLSYAFDLCPDPMTTGIIFWTEPVPGWYTDCNEDQVLDVFDFLCFINRFNDGDEYADCDGNGALDLFDFLCFVNCYFNC